MEAGSGAPEPAGSDVQPVLPAPADPTPGSPSPPLALPSARQLLSVGLDLCLRANPSLRTASMAVGFQVLGAVGPIVVLLIVVAGRAPDLLATMTDPAAQTTDPETVGVAGSLFVTGFVAGLAVLAMAIESRILAVGLLGGHAIGRPVRPLEALRRSRQVFWPVAGATVLIQVVVLVIVSVVGAPLGETEASLVVTTGLTALLSVPFVYLVSGIVLGAVPAIEAIRRSVRMARTRWRLAFVVAIAETLAQTLLMLALLAGLDILARISDVLGLGLDSGSPTTFVTIVIALLATAAFGSLLFLTTALAAAPQVVAFVGLTAFGAGLDRARDDTPGAGRTRWLSVPMAIGVVVAALAAFSGISTALQAG